MAPVSYLRPTVSARRSTRRPGHGRIAAPRSPRHYAIGGAALLVAVVVLAVVLLATSRASVSTDSSALANINLPLGGGHIVSVNVVDANTGRPIPVSLQGGQLWPRGLLPANERVSISAVVKRAGWVAWLSGGTEHLSMTLTTPSSHLDQKYLTVAPGAPLRLQFAAPVEAVASGQLGDLHREVLPAPQSVVTLDRTAPAGTVWVSAVPRSWETGAPALVTWFPAGARPSAVVYPNPGASLDPTQPITLTFSRPVDQVLGGSLPALSPSTPGNWQQLNDHTIVFRPQGYGYGLATKVSVALPAGIQLVSGQSTASATTATWTVPAGSTMRLQQLLAQLGYLPLQFNGANVAPTPQAQESAAINPPSGSFSWRWGNAPGALTSMWRPGTFGEMTKGAIMAFENDHNMTPDGVPGGALWRALIGAAVAGQGSTFGYTFVQVSEGSPESINVWHSGRTVVTGPVNTGIPSAPTAQGVFAVFEHALSVTMSGTNPDGSHYDDPGVPYVSYFNGGDALHGFERASYGSAQSLGCVEMPYSEARSVYPYTPIGTLVDVS